MFLALVKVDDLKRENEDDMRRNTVVTNHKSSSILQVPYPV